MTGSGARVWFVVLAAVSLGLRFWFAQVMPFTGDEAYFYWWGRFPDWGFYDHPPMIGWWLAGLSAVSQAEWWLRLPIVIQPVVLALAVALFLRDRAAGLRWGAAILVLLAPVNVWNIFVTTDTPLIYFSVLSALAFARAARDDDLRFYALAGLLLGGAFLSKYFSAFLGIAYFVYCAWRPCAAKVRGLLVLSLCAVPALVPMVWWNMEHCWSNIMFNVFNRNDDAGWAWYKPVLYVITLLYVLTPVMCWRSVRSWRTYATAAHEPGGAALTTVAFFPLALFAIMSIGKTVGLHWVLSFVPLVIVAYARAFDAHSLNLAIAGTVAIALIEVLLIAGVAMTPLESWRTFKPLAGKMEGVILTFKSDELLAQIRPYREQGWVIATDGYSNSVTLAYKEGTYWPVFGRGSSHARHDDILTNFKRLDGRDILVLVKRDAPVAKDFEPYFRDVDYRPFEIHGGKFWLVEGRGFDYAAYREGVLEGIRQSWYDVPAWLPQRACYFCSRYFPDRACQAERAGSMP